ncbi:MAG TPA: ATP-binding protein [Limnobacter sp.]|nr:ATP-binding protein [Limnobacter sp.]
MRVATKINLAILSTVLFAVVLVVGNLYIISEQFRGLQRLENAQGITRLSTSLLVLTQEYVLFRSPSVVDGWYRTHEQLEQLLAAGVASAGDTRELKDIQQSLAGLKPIFSELLDRELPIDRDPGFLARRESLIIERLIAETQVISDLGYQWSNRVNAAQESSLKGLTLLESVGLTSFVLVIAMLVLLMKTGVLNPLALLKRTADAIRNGEEDAVCPVTSSDELGDVARAVNQMAHNLAHKNRRLRDANARVEQASRAKTEFLSNMSHEIRTPLNGIVGLTYLLKDTSVSSNQRVLLDSLEKTSRNLIDLVTDVLDISKIEAGSMELESRTFSTLEFLDRVAGIMTGAAASKPIELLVLPSPDLPPELVGDELRLRQVVVNLLGNAIKFTRVGHVHLKVTSTFPTPATCRLRVEVEDTGIGISPEGQENLFKEFAQADTSVAREFGGSGLGLNLVKKLVGLMGGTLGFQSEPGKGSTFWAEIDFRLPGGATQPLPETNEACSLLLVSSHAQQIIALRQACALVGRRLKACPDLQHALEWISRGEEVSGVVLDFPKERIERQEWLQFIHCMEQMNIPCAVLASSDDTRRLLEYGLSELFSATFVKPLTPLQLKSAFRTSGLKGGRMSEEGNPDLPVAHRMNLLIVDDSELNLKVLEGILTRKKATITKASNGLEAVSMLLHEGHGFDAVVMDVQMPLMDGLEATRELRRQPFNAGLPVIGLTGEVSTEDHRRALEAGMNAVLHKPLQPDELMQILKKMVRTVPA